MLGVILLRIAYPKPASREGQNLADFRNVPLVLHFRKTAIHGYLFANFEN